MESVILIDFHLEVLPMIMAMKRNIEEGDIITIFMDIDLMLMEIDITVPSRIRALTKSRSKSTSGSKST